MKKVLVIDESSLFRDYLMKKLSRLNFEVVQAMNGLDGMAKMRSEMPDLVIMDYYLSRKSAQEVLTEKKQNPNTAKIPIIMVSAKVDKQKILETVNFNVKKFYTKPVKMEALIKGISEILGVSLTVDTTPCIIEAHFNEDILFIEISQGLNWEKLDLLKYKIVELLELYQVKIPRVLVMMSGLELAEADGEKVKALFNTILEAGNTVPKLVKILTTSGIVSKILESDKELCKIGIYAGLEQAMDELLGLRPDAIAHDQVAHDKLLTMSKPKKEKEESFQLRFDRDSSERKPLKFDSLFPGAKIAVVDDDIVIQELLKTVFSETKMEIFSYENGKEFVKQLDAISFDVVFLDLMMPEMNGFQVLQYLKQIGKELPIIVFSALSKKETVVKAVSYGITSYMIKPLKPEKLMQKALEVLNSNF
jgi:DNA-binding response OmpR family regulator